MGEDLSLSGTFRDNCIWLSDTVLFCSICSGIYSNLFYFLHCKEEMEENGYANFEEATSARVDYAMEKALFPGEPITTTIHALRACLMDDEDIIYKQTGKKYKKIKKEKPYEHNEKILQKLKDEGFEYPHVAMSILNIDVFSDKITPQMEEKIKIESENIKRR